MRRSLLIAAFLAASLGHSAAQAGEEGRHRHAAMSVAAPSTLAYEQAMVRMHAGMKQPLSGNPDVDFVRQMIPHHRAAVEMAAIQLAHGTDPALKAFSRWIIFIQEQEIGFLENWLRGHDNDKTQPGARDYYGPAMQRMHHAMMIEYTGDADADFVRGMIPHHQAAVEMAAIQIAEGLNPEIRALAEGVLRSQSYEIAWQRHWLAHRHESPCFPSFIF